MSRPNGTYLLPEREVYVEDSYENKVWEFYHEQTRDPILAYAVEIKGVEGDTVRGNLIELDYAAHVERMQSSPFRLRQWQSLLRTMPPLSAFPQLPARSDPAGRKAWRGRVGELSA